MSATAGQVRLYTPARANPQSIEHMRIFLQQELDKIAQALAATPRVLGAVAGTAAGQTGVLLWVNIAGTPTLSRVEVGAADSGGVGYRVLRVPN